MPRSDLQSRKLSGSSFVQQGKLCCLQRTVRLIAISSHASSIPTFVKPFCNARETPYKTAKNEPGVEDFRWTCFDGRYSIGNKAWFAHGSIVKTQWQENQAKAAGQPVSILYPWSTDESVPGGARCGVRTCPKSSRMVSGRCPHPCEALFVGTPQSFLEELRRIAPPLVQEKHDKATSLNVSDN